MTRDEFEAGLDRWGADLMDWPPAAAALAREHLLADPGARQTLAAAAAVDGYLAGLRADTASADLGRHLLVRLAREASAPTMDARPDPTPWPLLEWLTERLWRPALLALVPVLAGFLIGHGGGAPTSRFLTAGSAGDAAAHATAAAADAAADAEAEADADEEAAAAMATLAFSDLYAEFEDAQW